MPTTFLLTSFYWENFIFFGLGPQRGKDGVLAVTYPMARKEAPEHRRRGHRQVRLRDLQAWRRAGRPDHRDRTGGPDRRGDRRRPKMKSELNTPGIEGGRVTQRTARPDVASGVDAERRCERRPNRVVDAGEIQSVQQIESFRRQFESRPISV